LVTNQINEIYIASAYKPHLEKIKKFILERKLRKTVKTLTIRSDCESFGDALREVAEHKVLDNDFVVVRGDIITNIDLKPAIE